MNWILLSEILYIVFVLFVCARVIYDTQIATKTLAYLLLVVFVPFLGIIFYFSFGINYRKRKIYSKGIFHNIELKRSIENRIRENWDAILTNRSAIMEDYGKLGNLVLNQSLSPVTENNDVELLLNGENKFPQVMEALKNAKNHIHLEYYIFEADVIGRKIIDLLIEKAQEGVAVRVIYDDFGSRGIRKREVARLKGGGVETFPFYKIKLIAFANRLNYRNHRKIIVVDGQVGFVGGINISDKYINEAGGKNSLFWRDTHLKIEGPAVKTLQYIFLGDWNYCSGESLGPNRCFFPEAENFTSKSNKIVQIVASGPDSDTPLIMQSLFQAINLAKEEVLITTPYFIPGESLKDCLLVAASSGVKVKLLLPGISDSRLVNLAARSYFKRLLNAGTEIYFYQKGFVHAKTLVVDKQLAIVGTANMDIRSFDLNFEVNALIYDWEIAQQLTQTFYEDIAGAIKIDVHQWNNRPMGIQLVEKIAGLLSPLL
ncbi:MAG: cardiolipin synthase [Aequorivita sp.]